MYFKVDVKYEANEPPSKSQTTMDLKSKATAGKKEKGAKSKKKSKAPVTAVASKRNVKLEWAFDAVRERIGDQTDFSQFSVKSVPT